VRARAEDLRREVDRFVANLVKAGVARDYNPATITYRSDHQLVSWATSSSFQPTLGSALTIGAYLSEINERQFSVLFADFSLLQLSYSVRDNYVIHHRLAYVPTPVCVSSDSVEEFGFEDSLRGATVDEISLCGVIRFDYDVSNASTAHPASHLTVATQNCRIPVERPLSVGHFARFLSLHLREMPDEILKEIGCLQGDLCLPLLGDHDCYLSFRAAGVSRATDIK
jgi:hypothetical protein